LTGDPSASGGTGTDPDGLLGAATCDGATGTTCEGAAGNARDGVIGCARTGIRGEGRIGGGGMTCEGMRGRKILSTRPRWVSPGGTRGVNPKSLRPTPGTQTNWAELPRGADAPDGRVQDSQTNRPLSTTRYARGLEAPAGADPGSSQFSAARLVVVTTDAYVTVESPSPGSERRASATS
jgi:hypothetical protein